MQFFPSFCGDRECVEVGGAFATDIHPMIPVHTDVARLRLSSRAGYFDGETPNQW